MTQQFCPGRPECAVKGFCHGVAEIARAEVVTRRRIAEDPDNEEARRIVGKQRAESLCRAARNVGCPYV